MAFSPLVSVQAQERLVVSLAFIAGFVDAYGFITYATYLSYMSGNTTQSGYLIGEGHFLEAMPTLAAIIAFVMGLIVGNLLTYTDKYQGRKKVLSLTVTLLGLIVLLTELGIVNNFVHIATISFAMGIMNSTISLIGVESVNLTFVTGTLTKMAKHIVLGIKRAPLSDAQGSWDTQWSRAIILARLWGVFFLGTILSGIATPHIGVWALLVPIILILLLLVVFNLNPEVET